MKILRYAAVCLLTVTLLVPMAGAFRLTRPTPPVPAETAESAESTAASKPAETADAQAPQETPGKPETAGAVQTTEAMKTETETEDGEWNLLLVNPWTPLPEDFNVELVTLASCGLKVDKRIRAALNEMYFACQAEGLRPMICSAYRTQTVQTRLYNNKIARLRAAGYGKEEAVTEAGRWVALPGTSEHQTGLALDIVDLTYQVLDHEQENTAVQRWLMAHCAEYGFILRYPTDKGELTGVNYEPWHYRYVGETAAREIMDGGLCLEEYLSR